MKMRKFSILLILLLSINFANAIATIIDPEHPLVVIDFDKTKWFNVMDKKCEGVNLEPKYRDAYCKVSIISDQDLHNKGYYLCIDYNVEPINSKVGYLCPFCGMDLSLFNKLEFYIKGDKEAGFNSILKVKICTWNQEIFYIITNIETRWKKYSISLDEFTGNLENFNWEGVEKLLFTFENVSANVPKGRIYIDDIKFLPKKDVSISIEDFKLLKYTKPRNRLIGFPKSIVKKINLNQGDKKLLLQIAKDTWLYFANIYDRNTFLIMDHIKVGKGLKDSHIGDYTNITNVGLHILCILAAYDFGFINEKEAVALLRRMLKTLKKLKKWKGLFYNWYLTKNAKISCEYISTVDNGWMAAGLICLRNSFNGKLKKEVDEILNKMDFSKLYDPSNGQMRLGYHTDKKVPTKYHYGLIATEPRVASLIAIGKGDVPKEHWFKVYRTLPVEWDWQRQKPKGKWRTYFGVKVFEGYYTYAGEKIVPSWGGSMFEFLMPTIVINEKKWAPNSFGLNNERIVKLHIAYAKERGYKFWGFSPCSTPDNMWGGYHEFGITVLGAKGYEPEGIVTPHAIILALSSYKPKVVMKNLRELIKEYPEIYGEYGLYDSVDIENDIVTHKYLGLDQGMILVTLDNYLNNGVMQKRFEKDPIFQNVKELLLKEKFFE